MNANGTIGRMIGFSIAVSEAIDRISALRMKLADDQLVFDKLQRKAFENDGAQAKLQSVMLGIEEFDEKLLREEAKLRIEYALRELMIMSRNTAIFGDFFRNGTEIYVKRLDNDKFEIKKMPDLYPLAEYSFEDTLKYFNALIDNGKWTRVQFPIYDEIV